MTRQFQMVSIISICTFAFVSALSIPMVENDLFKYLLITLGIALIGFIFYHHPITVKRIFIKLKVKYNSLNKIFITLVRISIALSYAYIILLLKLYFEHIGILNIHDDVHKILSPLKIVLYVIASVTAQQWLFTLPQLLFFDKKIPIFIFLFLLGCFAGVHGYDHWENAIFAGISLGIPIFILAFIYRDPIAVYTVHAVCGVYALTHGLI